MIQRLLLSAVLLSASAIPALANSANDDFVNAFQLTGNFGTISGDNIGATVEPGEPIHAGNDGGASIWYYWNAPRSGLYRFDTLGSNFDTLLGIYRGSTVSSLSLVAENDQAGGLATSSTVFNVSAGIEYEIAVDGFNDGISIDIGSTQLTWEQINPPQADFDRNDFNDLFLFAPATGRTRIMSLSDRRFLGTLYGPTVPDPYEVSDTGDFNFDGNPDIVLRNERNNRTVIWLTVGGQFAAAYNGPTLPANYYLAAVDDFNDDGEEDYLIANSYSGRTVVWTLNAGVFNNAFYGPRLPSGWEVAGAVDINIDGNPDFVIYQKSTGRTAFWLWNGQRVTSTLRGPTVPAGYRLTAVGDYNRDGYADLLIIAPKTGRTFFWMMNRSKFVSSNAGPRVPASFGVAAPR